MRWWCWIVLAAAMVGCAPKGERLEVSSEPAIDAAQATIEARREYIRKFVKEHAENISKFAMKFAKSDDLTKEIRRLIDEAEPATKKKHAQGALILMQKDDLSAVYADRNDAPIFVTPAGIAPQMARLTTELESLASHGLAIDTSRWQAARAAYRDVALAEPELFAFTPEESAIIAQFIETQQLDIDDPVSVRDLIAKLVDEQTPVPRLREAVLTHAKEMTRTALAAARLEIETADLAMRFARAMAFENMTHLTAEETAAIGRKPTDAKYAKLAQNRTTAWFRDLARVSDLVMPHKAQPEPDDAPPVEDDNSLDNTQVDVDSGEALNAQNNQAVAERMAAEIHTLQTIDDLIDAIYPAHPDYKRLMAAHDTYASLPDWERVVCPAKMRLGASYKCIPNLKRRLAAEGYYAIDDANSAQNDANSQQNVANSQQNVANSAQNDANSAQNDANSQQNDVFDDAVRQALHDYLETHQMVYDAEKGYTNGVWTSLNTPRTTRLAQIDENLRRWHKSYIVKSPYYIFINVPEFYGEVWRDGDRVYRFPIVVGNARKSCNSETKTWTYINATPLMHARMLYVEYNPYWNVPGRIEQEDYIKKINADPNWLQDHGFEYYSEKGYTILRQLPSESNALGRVKFIIPNAHATFMHDSPKKGLFRYPIRAFSHGCMRVWEPLELAKRILTYDGQWRDSIATDIDDYVTRRFVLKNRFDVFIDYFTVKADEAGRVHFFADPYRYVRDALEPPTAKERSCTPRKFTFVPRERAAGGEDVAIDED